MTQQATTDMPAGGALNRRLFRTAAVLARKGRYAEADEQLDRAQAAQGCSPLEALDLRARMYAQQGQYVDAERCWRKARALTGSEHAYQSALHRIRRTNRMGLTRPAILAVVCVALAGIGLGGLLVTVRDAREARHAAAEQLAASEAAVAGLRQSLETRDEAMAARVAALDALIHRMDGALSQQVTALAQDVLTAGDGHAIRAQLGAVETHTASGLAAIAAAVREGRESDRSDLHAAVTALDARISQELAGVMAASRRAAAADSADRTQIESGLDALQRRLDRLSEAIEALRREQVDP